ncbi:MAG: sugar phosphate nucleotidyltransferase [Gammaproteobacteria bacterium]
MALILSGGSGTRLWPLSSRRQRRCLNTEALPRLDLEARA